MDRGGFVNSQVYEHTPVIRFFLIQVSLGRLSFRHLTDQRKHSGEAYAPGSREPDRQQLPYRSLRPVISNSACRALIIQRRKIR